MSNVTLFGFPRSTFVKVVGLILTAKGVPYTFHDTEDEMYLPIHLQRHPFGRVPALQHDDFVLYETSAIAAYVDDVLPGPKFTPADPRQRARMNQWMCNLNSYFYPEMIYHVSHERMVYPELGIPGNDLIVQRAMPKVIRALEGNGEGTVRRPAVHCRRCREHGRLFPVADAVRVRPHAGGQAGAAEIPGHSSMGQPDGCVAKCDSFQRIAATPRADPSRARMGAPPSAAGVIFTPA